MKLCQEGAKNINTPLPNYGRDRPILRNLCLQWNTLQPVNMFFWHPWVRWSLFTSINITTNTKKDDITPEETGFYQGPHWAKALTQTNFRNNGRSAHAIRKIRRNPCKESQRSNSDRKSKLSDRDRRSLLRLSSLGDKYARDIRDEMDPAVNVRKVQTFMHHCEHPNFWKANKQHELLPHHREKRLLWTEDHVT